MTDFLVNPDPKVVITDADVTELYLEEFPLLETNHPLLTTFDVATYA